MITVINNEELKFASINSASFGYAIFFSVLVSSLAVYFVMFLGWFNWYANKIWFSLSFYWPCCWSFYEVLYVLFPLENKSANEVAKHLIEKVFSLFGLPTILHSDNGTEFVNEIVQATVLLWPGKCSLVNGNPGRSQSQGLVKQGNRTVELMISAREAETESCGWSRWLSEIQCKFSFHDLSNIFFGKEKEKLKKHYFEKMWYIF